MNRLFILAAGTLLLSSSAAAVPARVPAGDQDTYSGTLFNSESGTLDLVLQPGYRYTYQGWCDLYCSDLDFALYEWVGPSQGRRGYWRFLAADRGSDDTPELWVRPGTRTTFRLSIIMARCAVEPCDYDVDLSW